MFWQGRQNWVLRVQRSNLEKSFSWWKHNFHHVRALSDKFLPSRRKSFNRVVDILIYKSRELFWGKKFLNIFLIIFFGHWAKVFLFLLYKFQQACQNIIPSVQMKSFSTFFHHHPNFSWFFLAFPYKFLPVLSKLHSKSPEKLFVENVHFLKKLNNFLSLRNLRKKCRAYYAKITSGIPRLHLLCPEEHFIEKVSSDEVILLINFADRPKNFAFWWKVLIKIVKIVFYKCKGNIFGIFCEYICFFFTMVRHWLKRFCAFDEKSLAGLSKWQFKCPNELFEENIF